MRQALRRPGAASPRWLPAGRWPRRRPGRWRRSRRAGRRRAARRPAASSSQNIFDVKPEAQRRPELPEPDATASAAKMQPGNNAPIWRACASGVTGYSSLPKPGARSRQPDPALRAVPGLALHHRRRGLAPGAQQLDHSLRRRAALDRGAGDGDLLLQARADRAARRARPAARSSASRRSSAPRTGRTRSPSSCSPISGIVMAFGKFFLLPIIGGTLFGWLTYALKTAHNFVGPLFAVSLVIVFFTFLRDNLPQRGRPDAGCKRGGGLFGGKEPPSHRFNAGEKVVFWGGVLLLGGIVVGSGLVLDKLMPGFVYTRGDMQIAHMIHAVVDDADDGAVPRPHLPRHDRHERRLQRDAPRLCRRGLGPRAPRALVRRHRGRQDPGAAQRRGRAPRAVQTVRVEGSPS